MARRPTLTSLLRLALVCLVVTCTAKPDRKIVSLTDGDSEARSPAWSPDGNRIAFEMKQSGKWSLQLLDVRTGRAEQLTRSEANDRHPAWSPDGERLVFVSDRTGEPDLHVLHLDTGKVVLLLSLTGTELFPAWSPDGRTLAFTRQLADSLTVVSVTWNQSDSAPSITTLDAGVWPRWSPDGSRLAYFSRRDTGGHDDEVYILEYPAGATTRLTVRTGHDFCPSWSPTNDRLIMVSIEPDGTRSLRVVDDQGNRQGRLGLGFHRITEPSWSPDGRFIAYAAVRTAGDKYQLFMEPAPDGRSR